MTTRLLWVLGIVGAFAALLIALQWQQGYLNQPANKAPSPAQVLAMECADITKKRLHDPASAQIPDATSPFDFSQFRMSESPKGEITIAFEMHSRNRFNALRKSIATCVWASDKKGGYTLRQHTNHEL